MKHPIALLRFVILVVLLCSWIMPSFAQDPATETAPQELTRKEKRKLKRDFKKLRKLILSDAELSRRYFEILNGCQNLSDEECQQRLNDVIGDTVEDSDLSRNASGLTFGICKVTAESKKTHQLVYSKRDYDCKLSSHGQVYDKKISRKQYGPGIWWDKQSIVLMCTGPAYGKKMTGMAMAVGAYYGITLTTLVGKVGICLVVGSGKSAGFYVGADTYQFEELEAEK